MHAGLGGCKALVPFLHGLGVSAVIARPRLRIDGYNMTTDAVYDCQAAVRLVRAHAAEWRLDPARIGIVGFSAGAELAAAAGVFYSGFDERCAAQPAAFASASGGPVSSRPDFVGLMWPGPTPFETKASQLDSGASRLHGMSPHSLELAPLPAPAIPEDVPPSIVVSAATGDRVHAIWGLQWHGAMLDAAVPNVELHLFGSGNHGGGGDASIPLGAAATSVLLLLFAPFLSFNAAHSGLFPADY
eukprot:SAG22_NODE_275_length_13171_cov_11.640606_9_plen_244_part_00